VDAFVSKTLETLNLWIKQNIADILSKITRFAVVFAFTPFILFYLLKDDAIFYTYLVELVPEKYRADAENLLNNIDSTLSTFITGQLFVAFIVGVILLVGFLVIGLEYALPLAMFGMILNTIPFIGPFIAITPALLVSWSESPLMALKVTSVMLVAHVIEANLISPQVMGQRLNVHPLTIVLLLLACGSLYGMLGMLLATPVYALCKVIASNIWDFYHLKRKTSHDES
jgi:predicted PurR-regulated permease PerM